MWQHRSSAPPSPRSTTCSSDRAPRHRAVQRLAPSLRPPLVQPPASEERGDISSTKEEPSSGARIEDDDMERRKGGTDRYENVDEVSLSIDKAAVAISGPLDASAKIIQDFDNRQVAEKDEFDAEQMEIEGRDGPVMELPQQPAKKTPRMFKHPTLPTAPTSAS
eukprot:CAMPEP_0168389552 /NCGR_PEP_ID=MMETSP0228-20121227/17021_1 /TAXON_ID=133427 /ORGANISM="Protoceratium reticulatum, Strain CCCM 535 (=CCMP 1889)" /LENGTH=163 /DNA_ID=CAMNT_0008402825 /DNA_START=150 /DNA_END=638 /DNA_ORIENTATION=-